ncbi:hypothetical protein [Nakamurella lactea]|uniref:hypothetical protein n=1 Tax=Nakamurella lactea TaxID=459515 RepID=UPI00041A8609|nr:hypothetical protein [Nakamurella lactea]
MKNRTAMTLLGFLVAVAAVFGGGYLIGSSAPAIAATGNADEDTADGHGDGAMDENMTTSDAGSGEGSHPAAGEHPADAVPPGLAVSERGYTLRLESPSVVDEGRADLRFAIDGPDGRPVVDYQRKHEKELHLIAVSRDLAAFRHVHPTLAADGTWSVPLELDRPGGWHVYADFTPQAESDGLVLATDLTVTGQLTPQGLPAPAATAEIDGYRVVLAGQPAAGEQAELTFTVTRSGRPVTDLTPYLGADGHLVALRAGDLAYLHTHPQDHEPTGGPQIRFAATFPTAGIYRVFLDFEHAGQVHTAPFTVVVDRH